MTLQEQYNLLKQSYNNLIDIYPTVILYGAPRPEISNIGDYSMFFGLLSLLKELNKEVIIKSHFETLYNGYNHPIIFRGGGFWSASKCWSDYLRIISEQPDFNLQIISPMSIYPLEDYKSQENEEALFKTKNIKIFLRESCSVNEFKNRNLQQLCYFCVPDTVICWNKLKEIKLTHKYPIAILRRDGERNKEIDINKDGYRTSDWSWHKKDIHNIHKMKKWESKEEYCLDFIQKKLGKASEIITDRLHAYIISNVLGIKNILYSNSYYKNYSYSSTWGEENVKPN